MKLKNKTKSKISFCVALAVLSSLGGLNAETLNEKNATKSQNTEAKKQNQSSANAKKEQSTAKNAPKAQTSAQSTAKNAPKAQTSAQSTPSAQKPKNAQNNFPNHQIFLGAGLLNGLSLGYRYNVIPELAVRADVNYWGYSMDFDIDDANLETKLKSLNFGVYADYFPFGEGFFLSGGLIFNSGNFASAKAKPTTAGSIEIDGHTYQYGPEDHIKAAIKFPAVRPYLGLGYAQRYENGFGFNFDMGAAIGKPKANFDISDSLYQKNQIASGAGYDLRSDIDKLESDINDYAKKYGTFYPMIKFSVSYAF